MPCSPEMARVRPKLNALGIWFHVEPALNELLEFRQHRTWWRARTCCTCLEVVEWSLNVC